MSILQHEPGSDVGVMLETGRHDFRIIAPHGSTINWMDVSDRKEIFEKEPNDDRQHAQRIELPVLVMGR